MILKRSCLIIAAAILLATLVPIDAMPQELPDHRIFGGVLREVVSEEGVDYDRLLEIRGQLDRYIASLDQTSPPTLARASRDDQLAFWINAYNACMLKIVTDHYPIRRGGAGFIGMIRNRLAGYPDNSVWQIRNVFTRAHCPVAGENRSQDEIEHEIIRPRFGEPRIHFAVNCAARSCPELWPEAYDGDRLDEQLDRAVNHLIDTPAHFGIEPGRPATARINKVLDWYQEDFGGIPGIRTFFAQYLEGTDRELLLRDDTRIEFVEYDWTLNDVSR